MSGHGGAREGAGRKPGKVSEAAEAARQRAEAHSGSALDVLAQLMADEAAPASARITAAKIILERAHGRPAQTVTLEELEPEEETKLDFSRLSDGALEEVRNMLIAAGRSV